MNRRAILSVPASEPRKIAKAMGSVADEIVIDLEDAVSPDQKNGARAQISTLRPRAKGLIAVRVNAADTPWFKADVEACVANAYIDSIVVPKAEDVASLHDLADTLHQLEMTSGRPDRLCVQALIETPKGLLRASEIASSTRRISSLIIGYADLSASLGRDINTSWQFAQDTLLLAARAAGVQAIDGPLLSIAADTALDDASTKAAALGFDGKWVIHPGQIAPVQAAFSPSADDVSDAREILEAMASAAQAGRGAVQWRGRMLDEAVAVQARRTLSRAT